MGICRGDDVGKLIRLTCSDRDNEDPGALLTNFHDALLGLPSGRRDLYIHAFQSMLWNAATSHRLSISDGPYALEGDLVIQGEKGTPEWTHTVTKDEELARKYTLSDVVLPSLEGKQIFPIAKMGCGLFT